MVDDVSALLGDIPPEVLQQLLGLSTIDDEDALLQQQMGMAEALRQPAQRHSTPLGAALGGLGEVVSNVGASLRGNELMKQRGELTKRRQTGRNAYVDALRAMGQRNMPTPEDERLAALTFDAPTLMTR